MSLILSGTDGLSDVDGSAATPAIRGTDANTGIFFPAADTIAFSEGGAESMRIDSLWQHGLGVTPSAWGGTSKALQLPAGSFESRGSTITTAQNAYFNGTNWIYSSTAGASLYAQNAGIHYFYNAASGTAGNTISFTQAMTLDASAVTCWWGLLHRLMQWCAVCKRTPLQHKQQDINLEGQQETDESSTDVNWGCIFQANRAFPGSAEIPLMYTERWLHRACPYRLQR
jgi:hypothetical protein